jgi:hypothetical protein
MEGILVFGMPIVILLISTAYYAWLTYRELEAERQDDEDFFDPWEDG